MFIPSIIATFTYAFSGLASYSAIALYHELGHKKRIEETAKKHGWSTYDLTIDKGRGFLGRVTNTRAYEELCRNRDDPEIRKEITENCLAGIENEKKLPKVIVGLAGVMSLAALTFGDISGLGMYAAGTLAYIGGYGIAKSLRKNSSDVKYAEHPEDFVYLHPDNRKAETEKILEDIRNNIDDTEWYDF